MDQRPRTGLGVVLRAQAATLRAQAEALETLAESLPEGDVHDALLDLGNVEAEGVSPHTARSWIRSGRLEAHQAERGRFVFRRSALLRALEASPVRRREQHHEQGSAELDAWEAEANATLHLVRGAR